MPDSRVPLTIESDAAHVRVLRTGATAPVAVQNFEADTRAFLHPIAVPGTDVPITEDAPSHHPWQHGLYVGINDINGAGFWHEGLHPDITGDGTFHPQLVGTPEVVDDAARWTVRSEYRDEAGATLLHETQAWSMVDLGRDAVLDLTLTFHAERDLTFGRYDYGGLFIRMPYRAEAGGRAFTSEGLEGGEADGQRARWAAAEMPIPGLAGEATLAILDHPRNREHPAPWRVDHELGIAPSICVAGPWNLAAGADETFRLRVLIFDRAVEASVIDAAWTRFAANGEV